MVNNTQPRDRSNIILAAGFDKRPGTGEIALAGILASSHGWVRGAAALLLAVIFLAATPPLAGQTPESPDTAVHDPLLGRFSIGGRGAALFPNLMNTKSDSSSSSDPPVETTIGTTSTASHLGGGVAIEFAIRDRLSVGVDVLYRRSGYKTGTDIVEGEDDEDTEDEDERFYVSKVEGTKANYWDIPVIAHLYDAGWREARPGVFLELGAAVRYVVNIRTFREYLDSENVTEVDETPVAPANRIVPGIVLGGGFNFKGGGLRVMPSVRYTRWMGRTFDNPPTESKTNQWEFLLGIMF